MEKKYSQFIPGTGAHARCSYGCMGCFYCEGRGEPYTKPKTIQKPKGWPTLAVIFQGQPSL